MPLRTPEVKPPTCGDRTAFDIPSQRLAAVGSLSNTSSAAPPNLPERSAASSASSSMMVPRETFATNPPGPTAFIT